MRGEGEETAVELAAAWRDGAGLGHVRGITWRSGREVVRNAARAPVADLDVTGEHLERVGLPDPARLDQVDGGLDPGGAASAPRFR